MHDDQYSVIAARRQAYDGLLWQTPALAVAAQGFLLNAALDNSTAPAVSCMLAIGAFLVAFAALQFFQKLRKLEVADSELLESFEESRLESGFAIVHGKARIADMNIKGLAKWSSYRIWNAMLVVLLALTLFVSFLTFSELMRLPQSVWLTSGEKPAQ